MTILSSAFSLRGDTWPARDACPGLPGPLGFTAVTPQITIAGASSPRLEELDVSSNDISAAGAQALGTGLAACTALRRLALRDNPLGDAGLSAALGALSRRGPAPQPPPLDLEASGCGLGLEAGAALAASLSGGVRLGALDLGGNPHLRGSTLTSLAAAAAPVARLDLSGCAQALRDAATGEVDPAALQALASLPGLRHLTLFHCGLAAAGATDLRAVMAQPGAFAELAYLDLGGNDLHVEPLLALLRALGSSPELCPSLETLVVGGNPGLEDGQEEFAQAREDLFDSRPGLDIAWRAAGGGQPQPE